MGKIKQKTNRRRAKEDRSTVELQVSQRMQDAWYSWGEVLHAGLSEQLK